MIPYPDIDPTIVRIGPVEIRWYGVMYLLGFAASYLLFRHQVKKKGLEGTVTKQIVEGLYFWVILGLILGARLGYVLFYNPGYYLSHPLKVLAVWEGGMSFHGGLIGVVVAGVFFCRAHRMDFWLMADLFVPTAPVGIGLGRLANFINGELYGRASGVPWAMIFPEGGDIPRHPSQLYEMFFEGVALFVILWGLKEKVRTRGLVLAAFLVLYGLFRFGLEFTRQPDPHLGFIIGGLSMGQLLSALMVACGTGLAVLRKSAARGRS